MKRLMLLAAIISLSLPSLAYAKWESNGQVLVTLGRTFSPYSLTETIDGGIYGHVSAFASVRGAAMLFGYIGPEFQFKGSKTNLKLLTGLWTPKDGGFSAIASIWLTQLLPSDLILFLEGDAYFPIDGEGGHSQRNYYTIATFDWFPSANKAGFGIVQENFFSEATFDELAIGPSLIFDHGRIWIAYDFTPEIKDDQVLYLRLVLNL